MAVRRARDRDSPGQAAGGRPAHRVVDRNGASPRDPDPNVYDPKIPADTIDALADEIAAAGTRFSSHLWRGAASGNLGGWQIARALMFLHVLTGSLGAPGGVNPNGWDKFVPKPTTMPPHVDRWNETIWPPEYPIAHYEMSFLLPHLLRGGTHMGK